MSVNILPEDWGHEDCTVCEEARKMSANRIDIIRYVFNRPTPAQALGEVVKEYRRVTGESDEKIMAIVAVALRDSKEPER